MRIWRQLAKRPDPEPEPSPLVFSEGTIPTLIVPVLNRLDLAQRLIRSIDMTVDRFVVVDNTPEHDADLGDVGREIQYLRPLINLGYPGSINAGIMQTPRSSWWMWCSNDIVFGRGDLEAIVRMMDAAGDEPVVVTGGFTWGCINHATVDALGLMDEWSFYPIYFDDNDYFRRASVAGVRWVEYIGGVEHGADGHTGSLAIKSDKAAAKANDKSFVENERRYIEKWGGLPGAESYPTPWNSGQPVWATKPDTLGRARRLW